MIAFRTDANAEIGMGHYMRCFAIARRLCEIKETVVFLIAPDADENAVLEQGFSVWKMQQTNDVLGWDASEAADLLRGKVDTLLIDTYRINAVAMKCLVEAVPNSFYLDDLHAFDYPIGKIINYNLEANSEMYAKLLPNKVNLYLGPSYYPVREEIVKARVQYLRTNVRRILIATGATDPLQVSLAIVQQLVNKVDAELVVQIGRYYDSGYIQSIEHFSEQYSQVKVLGWTKDMGELYASCDICITSGSSMMNEAMTVGIPCISFSFVDNQIVQCEAMENLHFAPYAGDFRKEKLQVCLKIENSLVELLSFTRRKYLHTLFKGMFDGRGGDRVANLLMTKEYV